jgi:hypothetical protein
VPERILIHEHDHARDAGERPPVIYEPIEYLKRAGKSKIRAGHFVSFILLVVRSIVLVQSAESVSAAGACCFLIGVGKLIQDIIKDNLSETAVMAFLSGDHRVVVGLLADMIARLQMQPPWRPEGLIADGSLADSRRHFGVVVAILLSIVPLRAVMDALGRVSVWTWSASVVIFFAGHYLNAIKAAAAAGARGALTLDSVGVRARAVRGPGANLGLPGLAGGDLVRAAYLSPITGLNAWRLRASRIA